MLPAMASSIQDRTPEFHSILSQAQTLLQNGSAATPPTRKQRSEFARNAAAIGRGISATMGKLQRLGELAKRKTLFDDRPVEIAELTYVIKQDLAGLNQQIGNLQTIQRGTQQGSGASNTTGQEGEHNKNVVMLLQGKLADVGVNFKEVLEVRTKNIQASRSRQDNFVSSVSQSHAPQSHLAPNGDRSDSPLYQPPSRSRTPGGGGAQQQQSPYASDVLSLDPSSSSPLYNNSPQSQQQLQIMEEGSSSNSYIQQRGEAIEAIERTIADLGGIFGQLATMVSEQAEQIQRIDANTDDVVDNVEGAQRELMKYWGRVQGNRWLVAKMFGVLMICEFPSLSRGCSLAAAFPEFAKLTILPHSLPPLGPHSRLEPSATFTSSSSSSPSSWANFFFFSFSVHFATPSVTITQISTHY
jgi:syntaxin 5